MDIQKIVDSWKTDEPIYKKIEKSVVDVIKKELVHFEILPEISSRTKDLLSIIKKIKKESKEKEYSYDCLKDKLGVRIICTFESELQIVDEVINRIFDVKKPEKKKDTLDFDRLSYLSNHYDVCIKELPQFKYLKEYTNYVFEIQVRTINQHAWSNASHKLIYKRENEASNEIKRKLYRLLALYELADQEIESINTSLKNEETGNMRILQKIEGKFYKYAKVEYDKEITLDSLSFLSNIFLGDNENKILNEIEAFIQANDKKITGIFEENRFRFYEIPILTQPEILIIWFALENFEYALTENWNNHFDTSDLDVVQVLWGGITD